MTVNANITNALGTFAQMTVATGNTFALGASQTIADVMPRGTSVRIRAAVDGFAPGITAEIPLPAPFPLESGRRVTLGWNRADSYLLPVV